MLGVTATSTLCCGRTFHGKLVITLRVFCAQIAGASTKEEKNSFTFYCLDPRDGSNGRAHVCLQNLYLIDTHVTVFLLFFTTGTAAAANGKYRR